jgi:hypothetical protein
VTWRSLCLDASTSHHITCGSSESRKARSSPARYLRASQSRRYWGGQERTAISAKARRYPGSPERLARKRAGLLAAPLIPKGESMRTIAVFLFIFLFTPCSYGTEAIKTNKIDTTKTRQLINEYNKLWARFRKEDTKADYKHVVKKFVSNYILNIFFTPAVGGNIITIVQNDKGEIVLKQDIFLNRERPQFDYEESDDSMLISYQTRVGRNVGPGLSLSEYERRVELYTAKKVIIYKLTGDIANHSFGDPKAVTAFTKTKKANVSSRKTRSY